METNFDDLLIVNINNENICLRGIGRLFYEKGLPISISIEKLKEYNIKVSILHVADECLKNGWSIKTTINKIKADFDEDINKDNVFDFDLLDKFCNSTYEEQREIIFNYLFKTKELAIDWLRAIKNIK